ncbi:MAG: hypothetical protein B9S38_11570 [Verrucomicrobiia bacterium Tous-C4TDCM]|nr:MAG: hypothetical protein B9S38_11570 [Verrucomicrobiae bacterium Tous-C4TDCM]
MKFLLSLISRIVGSGLVVAAATPVAQEVYLKSSNCGVADAFGSAVAISGDTMVVGAPNECSNATGVNGNQTSESALRAGAAYVFVRSWNTWTQQAYLKASDTATYAEFGGAVAVDGDRVVIGAPQADGYRGAVHVFSRNVAAWTHQARLTASNTAPDARFGSAVAVSGGTIAVGARGESSGVIGNPSNTAAPDAGAAYVFQLAGLLWTQQAYPKASNPGGGDAFGKSLSLDGDTLVVGAAGEDGSATGVDGNQAGNSASGAGAAYVFSRSVGQWWQIGYLKASNTEAGDAFGGVVAVSGSTVVAGAARESGGARGVNGLQNGNGALNSGGGLWLCHPAARCTVDRGGAIRGGATSRRFRVGDDGPFGDGDGDVEKPHCPKYRERSAGRLGTRRDGGGRRKLHLQCGNAATKRAAGGLVGREHPVPRGDRRELQRDGPAPEQRRG